MSAGISGGTDGRPPVTPIPEFRVVWDQIYDLMGILFQSHNRVADQLELTMSLSLQGDYQAKIANTKQDYEAKIGKLEDDLENMTEEFNKEREEWKKLAAENEALVEESKAFRSETKMMNAFYMGKIEELTKEIADLKAQI